MIPSKRNTAQDTFRVVGDKELLLALLGTGTRFRHDSQ